MKSIIAKAALVIALATATGFFGYYKGIEEQASKYVKAQEKANTAVIKKNDKMQDIADDQEKVQIIYKDRIVTKYQTITNEVTKYETTEAANLYLDPEFVRLHNAAASANDQASIAESSGIVDGEATPTGVTTGEAIAAITRNYETFYQCKLKTEGWEKFYSDLQKEIAK